MTRHAADPHDAPTPARTPVDLLAPLDPGVAELLSRAERLLSGYSSDLMLALDLDPRPAVAERARDVDDLGGEIRHVLRHHLAEYDHDDERADAIAREYAAEPPLHEQIAEGLWSHDDE